MGVTCVEDRKANLCSGHESTDSFREGVHIVFVDAKLQFLYNSTNSL